MTNIWDRHRKRMGLEANPSETVEQINGKDGSTVFRLQWGKGEGSAQLPQSDQTGQRKRFTWEA